MKGQGFQTLRIAVATTGTVLASLFGAVTRSVRASTNLPVAYTSSTRWQVLSSDCADRFGLPGHACGLGVLQYTEVKDTSLPTTYVPPPTTYTPPPTTYTSPTTNTPPSATYTPPPPTYTPPPTTYTPPPTTAPTPTTDSDSKASHPTPKSKKELVSDILAFNNSLGLAIGNEIFKAPSGRVDLVNGAVTAGPRMTAGLYASVQYQFFGSTKTTRAVFTFSNPTDAVIDIDMRTNIGGFGGDNAIAASSNTANQVAPVNRWYETMGSADSGGGPSVLFVACASNGRWTLPSISKVDFSNGVSDYVNRYDFKVSAGDTAAIMVFAQANTHAIAAATVDTTFADFSTLDSAGLLNNLPIARKKILNWNNPIRPRPLPNRPLIQAPVKPAA